MSSKSAHKLFGSMSTITGTPPAYTTALADATNVFVGTITSLFFIL